METVTKDYVVRNCLSFAYEALRSRTRLMGETTQSYYENYFQILLEKLGPPGKKWDLNIPNSEVESFYLGNVSVGEFRLQTHKRVFSKVSGWEFPPFSSVVWSECCSVPDKSTICSKLDSGISRQIWEIFMALDVDSQNKLHVDDLCDLIQRILRENGHIESEQNIKEWFCDEILIDFWSFFTAVVNNFSGLLKPNTVRCLHELVFSEVLLVGKLTKKGHKIHSWKERWFSLQPSLLSYFESYETMFLKGTITIGADTQFEFMQDTKSHQRRFRVIDCQTQVPYEICTPDVISLQNWNYAIKVAIAMNKVTGTNFLHKLTQAQRQVFPENTTFGISVVMPIKTAPSPTAPEPHRSLSPSHSVPLAKSPPPPPLPTPYGKTKAAGNNLVYQSSVPAGAVTTPKDEKSKTNDPPPPIPYRKNSDIIPIVIKRVKPEGAAGPSTFAGMDAKARRRHSSITYSAEFEKEQQKEREKMEHVTVGGALYAVVKKPSNNNNKTNFPPLSEKDSPSSSRQRPRTPSPSAARKGYVQLEFQNGMSDFKMKQQQQQQHQIPLLSQPGGIPLPAARTKWDYSTVIFDPQSSQKEKEKEFENETGANKRNKPLPPPPPSPAFKTSLSDSNILQPYPVPRRRPPQSLNSVNSQSNGSRQAGSDLLQSPVGPSLTQNGSAGRSKREVPQLPPKEKSIDTPLQNSQRPIPVPRRVVTPTAEAPPPIPARRSPLPP